MFLCISRVAAVEEKKKTGAALGGIIPAVISVNVPSFHIMKSFPLPADGIK